MHGGSPSKFGRARLMCTVSAGHVKKPDLLCMRLVERLDRLRGRLQQDLTTLFREIGFRNHLMMAPIQLLDLGAGGKKTVSIHPRARNGGQVIDFFGERPQRSEPASRPGKMKRI
jgi:hypothetical protein